MTIFAKGRETDHRVIGSYACGNGGVDARRAASFCFYNPLWRNRTARGARLSIPAGTASARLRRPERVKRQHDGGRYTIRERIDKFVDPGSFIEAGPLVGAAEYDAHGNLTGFTNHEFARR